MKALITAAACICMMLIAAPCHAQQSNEPSEAATYSVVKLLASAQSAVAALEHETDPLTREIRYREALVSLTSLYQLHGCQWALPELERICTADDFPPSYYGISADGRLAVEIDRLQLKNPVFDEYAIYLCTLHSLSARKLTNTGTGWNSMEFVLEDSGTQSAHQLTPDHPLWEQLERLSPTFTPPDNLFPGAATSYKQLFFAGPGREISAAAISLSWGEYLLEVPIYN